MPIGLIITKTNYVLILIVGLHKPANHKLKSYAAIKEEEPALKLYANHRWPTCYLCHKHFL